VAENKTKTGHQFDSVSDSENKSHPQVKSAPKEINLKRDRIVILGRRSAGKTVYLSLLYDLFWKSKGDFSMKAVNGTNHLEFIRIASDLRKGIWPAATQTFSQAFIEVTYKYQKKIVVLLDYPGEVFTEAFVKDVESENTRILLDHIDHAEAIILLVDPAHVVTDDVNVSVDNDYGLLQALDRVLNWAEGDTVPIVLVLTKIDESRKIINENKGTAAFVMKYFPKLVNRAMNFRVCTASSVQVEKGKDGRTVPKKSFKSKNLEKPLLYCFDVVDSNEERRNLEEKNREYLKHFEILDKKEKRKLVFSYFVIFIIFLVLIFLIILILPSSVWKNILDNFL